ncbi:MAG TPA: hypothetical protein VLA74_04080, partial [Nitrososphaeraceae archaeon]|nr:hypothetical protein [Nitrososphaeraceae archaeon]
DEWLAKVDSEPCIEVIVGLATSVPINITITNNIDILSLPATSKLDKNFLPLSARAFQKQIF